MLGVGFHTSPISLIDPGFPILGGMPLRQFSPKGDDTVTYCSDWRLLDEEQIFPDPDTGTLEPVSFSVFHCVTRFTDPAAALATLEDRYASLTAWEIASDRMVTEIPGLEFESRADRFYLWCENLSPETRGLYDPENVRDCTYLSVWGPYFSKLDFGMWPIAGGGRQFSVPLLEDVLRSVNDKLGDAR